MRPQEPPPFPWPDGTQRLAVSGVVVDLRYRQVDRDGTRTELPQRMFALLQLFLAEPHVLHARAELFRRIWGEQVVEDANLSQSIWMLRKALGPEHKDWIRTVAKRGYVFAPPTAVEVLPPEQPVPESSGPPATAAATGTAAPATTAPDRPPRHWAGWAWWATAACLLAATVWAGLAWGPSPAGSDTAAATPPRAIALIDVRDRAAAPDTRWPVTLAHAWLAWKLDSLPEVTLLGESDLAADTGAPAPVVVMLSSALAAQAPGEIVLRARLDDGSAPLTVQGPLAQAPALADALSRAVMARLLPHRADDAWPALQVDADAARRYAKAAEAFERRDWVRGLAVTRDVVRRAPRFGLAQLQMARAEARLGQAGPAKAAMAAARLNLQPLPADAGRMLDAEALAIDPQRREDAAAAFQALAQEHPERLDFALDQARFLASAGQAVEARAILQRPGWGARRTGLRIAHQLALAEVAGALGDAPAAQQHARQALEWATAAGEGWGQERGNALLVLAQADAFQHGDRADGSRYEAAAREFEAAGATADALYARVLGAFARPPDGRDAGLDTLLAKAHAEGYRQIEIDLLRGKAFQHYAAGEHTAYRKLLEQALAAARDAGDPVQQRLLDLDLLNEDAQRGDFDAAQARIARLRQGGLQGDAAAWVDQFEAAIAAARGQYDTALTLLEASDRRHRDQAPAIAVARSACARADLLQAQGQLAPARAQWTRCAAPDQDSLRMQARLGLAASDLLAGDRPAALQALHALAAETRDGLRGPEQWTYAVAVAGQLIRARDLDGARALLEPVLPPLRKAGYAWLLAQAETGLAEIEAARGDWPASQRHTDAARAALPGALWTIDVRLDAIAIAAALARGERNQAEALLARTDAQAHAHGDVVAQLELHSLMSPQATLPGCDAAARTALAARTGMRGATLQWLFGPLVARNPLWREQTGGGAAQ